MLQEISTETECIVILKNVIKILFFLSLNVEMNKIEVLT